MQKPDENGLESLRREANGIAARESCFWKTDHPKRAYMDCAAPPPDMSNSEMRASCIRNEAEARSALTWAESRLRAWQDEADDLIRRNRQEMQALLGPALLSTLRADVDRASAEVRHWRNYAAHYERQPPEERVPLARMVPAMPPDRPSAPPRAAEVDDVPF